MTENARLSIFNIEIKQAHSVKYIGVTLDRNLTLEEHVNNIQRKIAVGILLLHSLVLSHFKYASPPFTGLTIYLLHKLNVQLNWALRFFFILNQ